MSQVFTCTARSSRAGLHSGCSAVGDYVCLTRRMAAYRAWRHRCLLQGGIALALAISPIATHFTSVCLSVCRLSHSCTVYLLKPFEPTDLDAIWQVRLPLCWMGSLTPGRGKGDLGGRTLQPEHAVAIAAVTWRIKTRSDSAFSQITVDLFFVWVVHTGGQEAGAVSEVGECVRRRLLDRVSRQFRRGVQVPGHHQQVPATQRQRRTRGACRQQG